MKERWLTLILRLTNRIYTVKQSELVKQGLQSISNIFVLIFFEVILAIISFPLYLTISTKKATAFFEEKGGYTKIAVDYKLRKVLTLSGVGIIFIIWAIKFVIIILTPSVYGPLQLYSVSELEPLDIEHQELFIQDTGMQTARKVENLPIPHITDVEKTKHNSYIFSGTGTPGYEIVLFLVGPQTIMYSEMVEGDGSWHIVHEQKSFKLTEGIHSLFVFHYQKDQGIRSETSAEQYFRVKISGLERITENFDNIVNWSVVGVILLGIFLTLLTL